MSQALKEMIGAGITDVTCPITIPKKTLDKFSEPALYELSTQPDWPNGLAAETLADAKSTYAKKISASTKGSKSIKGVGGVKAKGGTAEADHDSGLGKSKTNNYGEAAKDKDDQEKALSSERGPQVTALKAEAKASVSALEGKKTAVGKAGVASAQIQVLTAEAKVGGKMMIGPKMITAKGEIQGGLYLAKGKASARTTPVEFDLLGETMGFQAGVEGDAQVGAWAKASGAVDIRTTKAEAGLSGSAEAFAGAKAGGKIFLGMHWKKKPSSAYVGDVWAWLKDKAVAKGGAFLKFIQFLERFHADKATGKIVKAIFGNGGRKNLARLSLGGEISAGIGGTAKAEYNIGRSFKFSASLKGTLGVGLGGSMNVELGYVDSALLCLILAKRSFGKVAAIWGKVKAGIVERLERIKGSAAQWIEEKQDSVEAMEWYNPGKYAAQGALNVAAYAVKQVKKIDFSQYV